MNALVIAPMRREARALGDHVLVCGAGTAAGTWMRERLREAPAQLVIVAGLSGGLDPSLGAGDVILGTGVVGDGRDELRVDQPLLDAVRQKLRSAGVRFIGARLLTIDAPAVSRAEKRDVWNAHGAAGVDMETYHVAAAAAECGVAWLALRAVVDPAGAALPAPLRRWRGETDDATMLREILGRPKAWPATVRLALHTQKALRALSAALPLVMAAAATVTAHEEERAQPPAREPAAPAATPG